MPLSSHATPLRRKFSPLPFPRGGRRGMDGVVKDWRGRDRRDGAGGARGGGGPAGSGEDRRQDNRLSTLNQKRCLQPPRARQRPRAMEGGPPPACRDVNGTGRCPPGHTGRPGLPRTNPDDTEVVPPARQTAIPVEADGGRGFVPPTHVWVLQAAQRPSPLVVRR